MHLQRLRAAFAVLAVLTAVSVNAASPASVDITSGLWEITVQTRSPILAAPLSHTVCIDKAHSTKPQPPKSKGHDDCQALPEAAAANETAYTSHCAKRKVTTKSRFTYSGDHYTGAVTITTPDGEVQQVYTAVRLGDCDDLSDQSTAPPLP